MLYCTINRQKKQQQQHLKLATYYIMMCSIFDHKLQVAPEINNEMKTCGLAERQPISSPKLAISPST